MKTKIMGILIFLFFLFSAYLLEAGSLLLFLFPAPIMIAFGGAAGLTVASYKKGMTKQSIFKKAKKYLIGCGYLGALCGVISVFDTTTHGMLVQSPELLLVKLSRCLIVIFLGYFAAYIVDTFIEE